MTNDHAAIIALLTGNPAPEQVLAIHPSPELQARASELLARNKVEVLSDQEELELDRILQLEHLVRMIKGRAYQQQAEK